MTTADRLQKRHESLIAEQAERIQEHAGYVMERIEAGRADSVGMYAEDIAASAQRIRLSVAALETLKEADEIREVGGEPVTVTHTAMASHDGYAPHSHEVRPDHLGIRQQRKGE